MTDKKKFIVGSRGSKLSLAYSRHVKNLLIKSNSQFDDNSIEIKIIKTSGDIFKIKEYQILEARVFFQNKLKMNY
jgi:porphobilinogen deaminase